MKISLEVPTSLLPSISALLDQDFVLAHIALSDPTYARFYRHSTRFKILDNGFHERNEPMTLPELRQAYDLTKPDVLIAPDWYGDAFRTYEGLKAARKHFGPSVALGVVLQGKNPSERASFWQSCMALNPALLCFPFRSEHRYEWFQQILASGVKLPDRMHLLGMSSLKELRRWHGVHNLSMDTGKPIKWGARNERLDVLPSIRGGGLVDHTQDDWTDANLSTIHYNIALLRKYASIE